MNTLWWAPFTWYTWSENMTAHVLELHVHTTLARNKLLSTAGVSISTQIRLHWILENTHMTYWENQSDHIFQTLSFFLIDISQQRIYVSSLLYITDQFYSWNRFGISSFMRLYVFCQVFISEHFLYGTKYLCNIKLLSLQIYTRKCL